MGDDASAIEDLTLAAPTIERPTMTLSDDERTFFAGLVKRVGLLRKARGITRVRPAEALGVSHASVLAQQGR